MIHSIIPDCFAFVEISREEKSESMPDLCSVPTYMVLISILKCFRLLVMMTSMEQDTKDKTHW